MPDIDVLFAGVAVADFGVAKAWYDRLFGRPADIVAHEEEVMWRISDSAWLYVVGHEAHAGHALVTLSVPDLDRTIEEIQRRGLQSGAVAIIGDHGRKASFTDPEGNTVSLIEVTG